ncbi:transcription elongation factor [Salinimicrobium oceani]|uniref:Transcription elongation factor n=1 Tax=Salinimicrobium oceani TaxID=2722702 RepID=A0ABX1CY53_9FLAO|nr:transcription elongation factor [Salinimicrobium oceani]NJW53193.1 transcription elongation factor [Salinimicrobium oceani]
MSINKEELYNKCLDLVNDRIDQYNEKMDTISGQNEQHKFHPDFDEYGNKGEMLTEYEKNAVYLDRVRTMKETLANLDIEHRSEVVRPGSVVETKNAYYFISVPLGEIDLESGSKVYAISTQAPLYKELEGRKAGDSFNFRDGEVEIVKVW